MSEREPPEKRHKLVYGSDGMKLMSLRTARRHRKELADARNAELMQYAAEDEDVRMVLLVNGIRDDHACSMRDSATEPHGSDTNPIAQAESHGVYSSDSDLSAVRTACAPRRDKECERGAPLVSPNNSCATNTTFSDNTLDDDEAAAISPDTSSDVNSEGSAAAVSSDEYSDVNSDGSAAPVSSDEYSDVDSDHSSPVDEPPQRESLSPVTDDGASSPIVVDFDRDNVTADKLREYIHSGEGDDVMFTESNLKTWQVVMIILGLCTRFSLNGACRRALIDTVRLFAGPRFDDWNITDYYISKIFDPPDEATQYHFYCEICCKELEKPVSKGKFRNHVATCNKCSKSYSLNLDAPNYFMSIDLEYQVMALLNLKVLNDDLATNLDNLKTNLRSGDHLRDVYDGSLYKKVLSETPPESRLLTCVFNTDGAPLFNSSKRAFWPILLTINELSPRLRFKYPLLAGVCVVRKEPSPDLINTFMTPFVNSMQRLSTVGFNAQIRGKTVHLVLRPLLCSVDSVARPLLQNRLQFNGYYGCSWCYAKGEHANGCMRFLMEDIDPMTRTHRDHMADVTAADKKNCAKKGKKTKSDVRGVKGNSVLTLLTAFDMIWAFVRDYLHGDLLGVILQLFNMWTADTNCPIRLSKAQLNEVNDRLMKMTPPREVHRLVRPLKTEKCKWKASEWRSWLLFHSVPCLTGILDNYALQHLALYVRSIYTLLQTSISETELQRVEYDLQRFVIIFEVLYGARYVTFNVHTVKHIVDCARCCGPLWATSAFPFESTIHDLKKNVHGPRNVCEQLSKKWIQRNIYRSQLEEADDSPACLAFQKKLFGRTEIVSYDRTGGVVFLGATQRYGGAAREFYNTHDDEITAFRRCISSGMVIHSAAFDKITSKSDNTVFLTDRHEYVQVLYLLKVRDMPLAEVACLQVEKVVVRNEHENDGLPEIEDVTIEHLVKVVKDDGTKIIRVSRLREKCVIMRVDQETFIARLPNTFEIQ